MNRDIPSTVGLDANNIPAFMDEWRRFQTSKVWAFLVLHVEAKRKRIRGRLEVSPLPEVPDLQAQAKSCKLMGDLLVSTDVTAELKDVLNHTNETNQ